MFPKEKNNVYKRHCWKWDFSRRSHREPTSLMPPLSKSSYPTAPPSHVAISTLRSNITLLTRYRIIEQRKSSWRCVSSRGVSMSVKGKMDMERNAHRKDPSYHRFVKPQTQLSRAGCTANIIKRNRIFWRVVETHGKMNIKTRGPRHAEHNKNRFQQEETICMKVNEEYQIQVQKKEGLGWETQGRRWYRENPALTVADIIPGIGNVIKKAFLKYRKCL